MNVIKTTILLIWLLLQYGNSHAQYDKNWVFGQGCHLIFEEDTVLQQISSASYNSLEELSISESNGILKWYLKNNITNSNVAPLVAPKTSEMVFINNDGTEKTVFIDNSYNEFSFNTINLKNKFVLLYKKFYDICKADFNNCINIKQKAAFIDSDSSLITPFFELTDSVVFNSDVVKHANGKDWWLVGHLHPLSGGGLSSTTFYRLLIKEDGSIEGPFYQDIGSNWRNNEDIIGPIRFSPKGKYLAVGKLRTRMIEVFDFDRCTGLLSNTRIVDFGYPIMPQFMQFSLNEQYLYVIQSGLYGLTDTTALYQYDIEATLTNFNKIILAFNYSVYYGANLSLASNGKIYLANRLRFFPYISYYDTTKYFKTLSVINYPDSAGLACGFEEFSFPLIDNCYSSYGLPNYPNFNLEALSIYEADAGRDTLICTDSTNNQKVVQLGSPKINGVQYQWYPNYNLSSDTSAQPLAFPDSTTMYYVTLTDTTIQDACQSRTDSVLVEVKNCVTGVYDPHTPKGGLRVYPNPASQEINLSINNLQSSINEVKVYDVAGRAIIYNTKEAKGQYYTLDIAAVTSGIYFIEVGLSNGSVERVKFIKQ